MMAGSRLFDLPRQRMGSIRGSWGRLFSERDVTGRCQGPLATEKLKCGPSTATTQDTSSLQRRQSQLDWTTYRGTPSFRIHTSSRHTGPSSEARRKDAEIVRQASRTTGGWLRIARPFKLEDQLNARRRLKPYTLGCSRCDHTLSEDTTVRLLATLYAHPTSERFFSPNRTETDDKILGRHCCIRTDSSMQRTCSNGYSGAEMSGVPNDAYHSKPQNDAAFTSTFKLATTTNPNRRSFVQVAVKWTDDPQVLRFVVCPQ
ncbi:hypothetical protein C8F01DRAFT_1370245 [Mycena amicta]|nr:hypothetical protein C8F01DRAFT_1370245 [Mycena amicta]